MEARCRPGLQLVLLPGMDGTGDLFIEFARFLSGSVKAVTIRYPATRYLCYSELEELLRSACPVDQPFVILAESFSTPLAIRYASTNPPNMRGLVLCAGFAASPLHGWLRWIVWMLAPMLFAVAMPEVAVKHWLVGTTAPASLVKAVRAAVSSVRPSVLAARLRAILECDVCRELGQLAVPILCIRGTRDRLVSGACFERIRQIQPGAAVVEIDAPHLLVQREPQLTAEAAVKFTLSLQR